MADKQPSARKSLADRLQFIDAQIADATEWLNALGHRRAELIDAERAKAQAILDAVEQHSGAKRSE